MQALSDEGGVVHRFIQEALNAGPLPAEKRYQWLARALTGILNADGLSTRQPLPTESQLAEQFGVSRQTVRRALDDLARAGAVERVAGRGTFLLPPAERIHTFLSSKDLFASDPNAVYEVAVPLNRAVDIAAAGRLGQATDVVYTASFKRIEHDMKVGVTNVYLPIAVGQLLVDLPDLRQKGKATTTSIIELIDMRLPGGITTAEQSITATGLASSEAHALGCQHNDIALQVDLLFRDAGGDAVELQSSYYLPHAFSYRSTFRRAAS
jgi:GntR family transcriptional regulator